MNPLRARRSAAFALLTPFAIGWAVPAQAAPPTQLGVYAGPGCIGRQGIRKFEKYVGRKVDRTVDALNQASWKDMLSSIDWTTRCWKGSGVALTLSVPMLPFDKSGTLKDGVAGKYDDVFRKVAAALVRDDHADAIVRIGWEFNGGWMPWSAARDPEAYKAYFRRIVAIMRRQPGQRFRFEWTTMIGTHAIDPEKAYPGDDVVDVIGMDIYNEVWTPSLADSAVRFQWYKHQRNGLIWLRDFAAKHGKPTAYSEWATGRRADGKGAGDDAVFVRNMAAWFRESPPLYQSYWEVRKDRDDTSVGQGTQPRASAAYRAAFGSKRPRD